MRSDRVCYSPKTERFSDRQESLHDGFGVMAQGEQKESGDK